MASLGQLVLVAGLAFLVLSAQDQGHGGPAGGGGRAIGAAAAATTPQPPAGEVVIMSEQPPRPPSLSSALVESKRGPIPKSGPSDRWNYEVNHEKPAAAAHRRTRTIDGRRLGSP